MFFKLPLELQVSVIKNLHADDLRSFLRAFPGLFDHIFQTYTDNASSQKTYFGTLGSHWTHAKRFGLINLIHITDFLNLDVVDFLQIFSKRFNVVVIELQQPKEDEFFDYDNSINKDPHRLNELLCYMTGHSTVLLTGLDKGFPLNLDDFDADRISIGRSPCVDIHGGELLSNGITCYDVKDILLQKVTQKMINGFDFSRTPYEALILSPDQPCVIEDKDVAAAVLLITNLKSLSNIKLKGKRLTLLYSTVSDDSVCSLDHIMAPDLLFLFVQFQNNDCFPLMNNISTPGLEQAWFRNEDVFPVNSFDCSLSMDFQFLSNVKRLTLEGITGPLVNCPTFNHLESLTLTSTSSLPVGFELYCPVLDFLEISGSSMGLIPELEAPHLSTYKLHLGHGMNTDQEMASNLPKVLSYYPKLTNLELKLYGVCVSVYHGIGSYLRSNGSSLEFLLLDGVSLSVFEDNDLHLPHLQKLIIKGTGDQQIDEESLSLVFNGPLLQELEIGSFFLKQLWVKNFPLLTSFSSTVSLPELHFEGVHQLRRVKVDGLLSSLHAGNLKNLKKLAYNVQPGKLRPADIEHVEIMNPKVKRIIKKVR